MRPTRTIYPALVLLALTAFLAAACSADSRRSVLDWIFDRGGPAAVEGAQVALTVAAEAAMTNVPVLRTAVVVGAATSAPLAQTLVSDGLVLAGTIGADVLATGGPIAGTAVSSGIDAVGTRLAEQPGYQCPADTYSVSTDLNGVVDISGAQLDAAIAASLPGNPLTGLGQAFVDAGRNYNINAYYIAAHAAWDSAWGTNAVATDKNNLFGYGVTPTCPYDCAVPFDSREASIDIVMPIIKDEYLTVGGRFYNQPNLAGIEPIYSGNAYWAESVAANMNLLRQHTPCP